MKTFLSFLLLQAASLTVYADFSVAPHAYIRGGVGNSLSGEKQQCFNNRYSSGNEFRLGNECGYYIEPRMEVTGKNSANTEFTGVLTFAISPKGDAQYGDENNDIDTIETYLSVKDENTAWSYWVGKRFYRDADVMINDFYYFAQMNGVGAGVKDIPMFSGKLSLAYLQQTLDQGNDTKKVKSYFDLRLFDIALTKNHSINLWAVYSRAPDEKFGTSEYENLTGGLFGFRLRSNLPKGFNDFTIIYGEKLMGDLNIYGSNKLQSGTNNSDKYNLRFVEHLVTGITDKISMAVALVYENKNDGQKHINWYSAGVRPRYALSEDRAILTELGYSLVNYNHSNYYLARTTIAYEIAYNNSIFSGSYLHYYLSNTQWNPASKPNYSDMGHGVNLGAIAVINF
ncbi:carbohydrate porin [Bacteriovorax sp. Seq25_V]|uniref:carbohydrate porin n=1 Tax=Bacteriovorax sp. Seq25_V TaxID=1201288 RepID=UPI00038A3095|nr:carbohydrate porin [Bacteriovorax sp. Seq25_V]EQC44022.1 LamB porin [Bacteriovorax sp. Seq25_V]